LIKRKKKDIPYYSLVQPHHLKKKNNQRDIRIIFKDQEGLPNKAKSTFQLIKISVTQLIVIVLIEILEKLEYQV